jgi:beta-galactosidase beta subunit
MLLNEFIYYSDKTNDIANDRRYDNSKDREVVKRSDTRKIKLTLKQINQLRLASEAHEAEIESEQGFIKQMYGQPPAQSDAGG